ncbi:MAG: uroporphyrinogen-III synthase [Bacteroidota bacterium]
MKKTVVNKKAVKKPLVAKAKPKKTLAATPKKSSKPVPKKGTQPAKKSTKKVAKPIANKKVVKPIAKPKVVNKKSTTASKSKTPKVTSSKKIVSSPTKSKVKAKSPLLPSKKNSKKAATKVIDKKKLSTKAKPAKKIIQKAKKAPINKTETSIIKVENKQKKERKNAKKIVSTIPVPKPIASNLPPDKKPKVKNILISQPYPENGKSPFLDIAQKWKLKVDFRTFIKVEGLSTKEFRRLKIYITDYSAIIFNSRNAIDYFFKLCEEMRVKLSQEMKYFCTSEAIALYLQKYIQYRKRKVFYDQPGRSLFDLINRFKDTEKFLYPCSRDRKDDIPNFLKDKKVQYAEAYIYQTIPSDLSDLRNIKYDMIVFFSPIGIKSLFHNYPDFIQDDRRIGGFGQVTWDSIADAGLRLDIVAPSPAAASMAQAIENYLKESNK